MENLFDYFVNGSFLLFATLFSAIYFVVTYRNAWKSLDNRNDLQEQIPKAVDRFKSAYGKTPSEAGFPVIGIYEKQSAYLYATSEKVIKAYKTQQNIIRWMMVWYLWPFPFAFIGTSMTMIKYASLTHPSFIAWCFFTAMWSVLGFVLIAKALIASRVVKFGKNVTYLNY